MGETYVETYLGCDIYYTTEVSGGTYFSPCITGYYFQKSAVKKRICTSQGGTWDGSKCSFEPEEPEEDTYIETYLGCKIYYTTRIVGGAYYSTCVEVYHHDILDAKRDICEQQDGVWDGTSCTFEIVPYWKHHSTYRGIDIDVWYPYGTPFTAYFDGGWHTAAFLSTLQAAIDDFLEPEPVGIPTTTTMSAPATVKPEEVFNIFGQLTRDDTGVAIPDMSISVSYNGTSIGSVLTDMQGVYTIPASILTPGTYTLKADYEGTEGYAASRSVADTVVAATPLEAAITIIGSAAAGLALFLYGTS